MPATTRRQAALQEQGSSAEATRPAATKPKTSAKRKAPKGETTEPAKKVRKFEAQSEEDSPSKQHTPATGTIERGHIYFFYRLKVQHEHASSLDDVKNFHMLLIPRPPDFATSSSSDGMKAEDNDAQEMKVLSPGADAVPAPASTSSSQKYRLITVGRKKLPKAEQGGAGKGRKETFWATVVKVGNDLDELEKGLGEKTYETKTRGTRHEEPARLVGRGGYALVNNDATVPSKRETHLGYHISHPAPAEIANSSVQEILGVYTASSFVLQVKNPAAPASFPGQSNGTGANYPDHIMKDVFGKGGKKGRQSYGLKFAACETTELLDHEGAQLLLIAARDGEAGLEVSLGNGRGNALKENEQREASESINQVFSELGLDKEVFPDDVIVQGQWI